MVQSQAPVEKGSGESHPSRFQRHTRAQERSPSPPPPATRAGRCPRPRRQPRAPGSPPARHCPAVTREILSHQWGRGAAGPCPSPRKVCPWFPHLKLPRRTRSLPPAGGEGRARARVGRRWRPGPALGTAGRRLGPGGTLVPGQHVTLPRWVPAALAAPGSGLAAVGSRRR